MRLSLFPIFWLLFLATLLMKILQAKIKVTNVPAPFQTAMEQALRNSKYRKHLVNWIAVSKMETDGWKSSLYSLFHNPWGMRPSVQRKHTQNGSREVKGNGTFATYKNINDAAVDIVLWMEARKFPEGEMDLYSFVQAMKGKGYFVEPVDYYYKAVKAQLDR